MWGGGDYLPSSREVGELWRGQPSRGFRALTGKDGDERFLVCRVDLARSGWRDGSEEMGMPGDLERWIGFGLVR